MVRSAGATEEKKKHIKEVNRKVVDSAFSGFVMFHDLMLSMLHADQFL